MNEWDIAAGIKVAYDDNGIPTVQPDAYGEEDSGLAPYQLHHFAGFIGIPHEGEKGTNGVPKPASCAPILTAWQNETGHAWALGDLRLTRKLPQLELGGAMMYGGRKALPAFQFLDGKTGSYQTYVPYGFSDESDTATPSKAMAIAINVRTPGEESIEIVHGDGMAITMTAADKSVTIKNAAGTAFLTINDDGVVANGTTILGAPTGAKALALAGIVEQIVLLLKKAILAGTFPAQLPAVKALLVDVPVLDLLLMQLGTKEVSGV